MTINGQYLRVDSGTPFLRPNCHLVALEPADSESIELLISQQGGLCRSHASWDSLFEDAYIREPGCAIGFLDRDQNCSDSIPRRLSDLRSPISNLWLSRHPQTSDVVAAIRSGATTVLSFPEDANRLAYSILEAQAISNAACINIRERDKAKNLLAQITQGERDVLLLTLSGEMNKTVARALDIAVRTVEGRRSRVFQKLGTRSTLLIARMLLTADEMPSNGVLKDLARESRRYIES